MSQSCCDQRAEIKLRSGQVRVMPDAASWPCVGGFRVAQMGADHWSRTEDYRVARRRRERRRPAKLLMPVACDETGWPYAERGSPQRRWGTASGDRHTLPAAASVTLRRAAG